MDFSTVKAITLPQGNVKELAINGTTVWRSMPDYLCFTANESTNIAFTPKTTQFALPVIYYSLNGTTWTKYNFGTNISLSSGDRCYWKGDNDFFGRQFIPSNYTPLVYIKSSGSQFFNTGYYPNVNTRVEMDYRMTATGAGSMFGTTNGNPAKGIWFDYRVQNSGNNYEAYLSDTNGAITGGGKGTSRTQVVLGDGVFTIKNASYDFVADPPPRASGNQSPTPMYIFTRNIGGTPSTTYTKAMELYGCSIYENNVLVRDYIPCKNSSNAIGVYDTINGTFTKSAKNNFTAGSNLGYRENEIVFSSSGSVGASGNVMSLVDSTMQTTSVPNTYCFYKMFSGCTTLTSLPKFPATTLTDYCYKQTFDGCSNIKLSTTQSGSYNRPFRIPTSENGTSGTDSLNNMFANTGGSFSGTPNINTMYYSM